MPGLIIDEDMDISAGHNDKESQFFDRSESSLGNSGSEMWLLHGLIHHYLHHRNDNSPRNQTILSPFNVLVA